jgi:hypothetical protein
MAKEVNIKVWCDRHLSQEDRRVEGHELPPITIDGVTKTLDLCKSCIKELVTPLSKVLVELGAKPEGEVVRRVAGSGRKRQVSDRGAPCLWCDRDFSARISSGYMVHLKTAHGFASAQEAFGTVCPICGQEEVLMMMGHVSKHHSEHGFAHTSQAVAWARDHGDPFGVYAAAVNRKPAPALKAV